MPNVWGRHFLGIEQMRATKRAANRPKDQLDLALLDELAGDTEG